MPYKLDQIAYEIKKAYEEWAELDAVSKNLEETKKPFLNQILQNVLEENSGWAMNKSESKALASDEYKVFIKGMVEARKAANIQWAEYEEQRRNWESRRSAIAFKREEIKHQVSQ